MLKELKSLTLNSDACWNSKETSKAELEVGEAYSTGVHTPHLLNSCNVITIFHEKFIITINFFFILGI
jgi:hypothetical protein